MEEFEGREGRGEEAASKRRRTAPLDAATEADLQTFLAHWHAARTDLNGDSRHDHIHSDSNSDSNSNSDLDSSDERNHNDEANNSNNNNSSGTSGSGGSGGSGGSSSSSADLALWTPRLRQVVQDIAATGTSRLPWSHVRPLVQYQMDRLVDRCPMPQPPTGRELQVARQLLRAARQHLDDFDDFPFTIQRLCELIIAPRQQYHHLSKLARAVHKSTVVTSSLTRLAKTFHENEGENENEKEDRDHNLNHDRDRSGTKADKASNSNVASSSLSAVARTGSEGTETRTAATATRAAAATVDSES